MTAADQRGIGCPPVFVGGTGRSGTTVTARLIGRHPDYFYVPFELRLHAEVHGLPGLIKGSQSLEGLLDLLNGRWHPSQRRKLARLVGVARYDQAVARLARGAEADPAAAGRQLVKDLLDPPSRESGKKSFVEMTPANAAAAPALLKLFPEMKLVHLVRDGRDVACSVAQRWDKDPDWALDWWERRVRLMARQTSRVPESQLLVLRFEDLAVAHRETSLERLREFLGLSPAGELDDFFVREMPASRANLGRWVKDLPPERRMRFGDRYEQIVGDLERDGVLSGLFRAVPGGG